MTTTAETRTAPGDAAVRAPVEHAARAPQPARAVPPADRPYTPPGDNPHAPCEDDCGIRDVLDRLGDRWSVLVVVELTKGTRRFRELHHAVPGISQRMLSVTAKRLVRDGLVERTVYPTNPPRTDYRLTAMGRSLAAAIASLAAWSRTHKERIAASRESWDVEHPGEIS